MAPPLELLERRIRLLEDQLRERAEGSVPLATETSDGDSSGGGGFDGGDGGAGGGFDGGDSGSGDFGGGGDGGTGDFGGGGDGGSITGFGGGDSMSPVNVVVAADGTITYEFAGHISADGLDLPEATTSPPDIDHLIRWLDSLGVAQQQLLGIKLGALHMMVVQGNSFPRTITLMNQNGGSSFLQLSDDSFGSAPEHMIDFGSDTAVTTGVNTATVVVNHDLVVAPIAAIATPRFNSNAIAQIENRTATTITFRISHRDAATNFGSNTTFDWVALR